MAASNLVSNEMKKLKIAVAITFLAVLTIQISVATASAAVGATSAGLAPEIAAESMTIPPEFSVKLFRGEPEVRQPIASR